MLTDVCIYKNNTQQRIVFIYLFYTSLATVGLLSFYGPVLNVLVHSRYSTSKEDVNYNTCVQTLLLVRGNMYVSLLSDVPCAEGLFSCLPTGCWSDQRAHSLLWAHEERQANGYPHAALVWTLTAPSAACDVWLTLTVERVLMANSFPSVGIICADWQSFPDVWI